MRGRRVCISAPGKTVLEEVTIDPDQLKPTEIVLQTQYTLISAAAEVGLYTGKDWEWDVLYPRYPGFSSVGVVTHSGGEVRRVLPGDLVFSYANHASLTVLDVARDFCLKVPEDIVPQQALFARLGSVAMTAPTVATYKPGDWVVLFGLGLVGNLAAQVFGQSGTKVIGVDLVDTRLELARKCGIEYTVKHHVEHLPNIVQNLTDGRGAEIVIDAIGNADCVVDGVDLLRRGGQVLLLGHMREPSDALASDLIRKVFLKWATVKSSWEWQLPQWESDQVQTSIESNCRDIFKMLQAGSLKVEELISHTIAPDEIEKGYEGLLNHKDDYWGVVIDWT